jgi:VanZ family protein
MGLVWFLSAQPDLNSGLREDFLLRKCAHVTEFAVLTALWARAIAGLRRRPGGTSAAAVLPAALVALVWAALDERHQHFVPGRVGAVHDVAIDAIGIVLAVAVLRWTRLGPLLGVPRPGGAGAGRSRRGRPRVEA